jgi:hypothetical protein
MRLPVPLLTPLLTKSVFPACGRTKPRGGVVAGLRPGTHGRVVQEGGDEMALLLILLLLLIVAIGGGIVISKFLFLVLLVVIAVAIVGRVGRSA